MQRSFRKQFKGKVGRSPEQHKERHFFEENEKWKRWYKVKIIVYVFADNTPPFTGLVKVESSGLDLPLEASDVSPVIDIVHSNLMTLLQPVTLLWTAKLYISHKVAIYLFNLRNE